MKSLLARSCVSGHLGWKRERSLGPAEQHSSSSVDTSEISSDTSDTSKISSDTVERTFLVQSFDRAGRQWVCEHAQGADEPQQIGGTSPLIDNTAN